MRNPLRHIALLALTLCVLLGSFGVALSREFCEVAALQPSTAVAIPDSCCGDKQGGSSDDCCEEQVSFQKLEPVQEHKSFHLPQPLPGHKASIPFLAGFILGPGPQVSLHTFTDSSPPRYGRQLLHFLHTLIV